MSVWHICLLLCLCFDCQCREKERLVCPDGFLDSQRYRSSYEFKQKSKHGSLDDIKKKRMTSSVVDVASRNANQQKDYEKEIKSIEVSNFLVLLFKMSVFNTV